MALPSTNCDTLLLLPLPLLVAATDAMDMGIGDRYYLDRYCNSSYLCLLMMSKLERLNFFLAIGDGEPFFYNIGNAVGSEC